MVNVSFVRPATTFGKRIAADPLVKTGSSFMCFLAAGTPFLLGIDLQEVFLDFSLSELVQRSSILQRTIDNCVDFVTDLPAQVADEFFKVDFRHLNLLRQAGDSLLLYSVHLLTNFLLVFFVDALHALLE